MTPDREPRDTVLEPDDLGADGHDATAREAAAAAGPLPEPRPELLARVLDGLRDLPAVGRVPGDGGGGEQGGEQGGEHALPLPRRRS